MRRSAIVLLLFSTSAAAGGTLAEALLALGVDSFVVTLLLAGFGGLVTTVSKCATGTPVNKLATDILKDIFASLAAGIGTFLVCESFEVTKLWEAFLIFGSGLSGALVLNIYSTGVPDALRRMIGTEPKPP